MCSVRQQVVQPHSCARWDRNALVQHSQGPNRLPTHDEVTAVVATGGAKALTEAPADKTFYQP